MNKKLLIIGAGGHGRVVADIAIKLNIYESVSFLDDDESIILSMGLPVIGKSSDILKYVKDYDIFIAVGNNAVREKLLLNAENLGSVIPILIHPNAVVSANVILGSGTVVMAGTVINCGSTIGKGCIINTAASIDHDCNIDDFVHISPGVHIAGTVNIGKNTWVGIGANTINNINIVGECIIGAGSIVVKDILKSGIYVGNPVRRIK